MLINARQAIAILQCAERKQCHAVQIDRCPDRDVRHRLRGQRSGAGTGPSFVRRRMDRAELGRARSPRRRLQLQLRRPGQRQPGLGDRGSSTASTASATSTSLFRVCPTPGPGNGVPTIFFADMNMQYGTVNLVAQKPDGDVQAVRPRRNGRLLSADRRSPRPVSARSQATAIRGGMSAIPAAGSRRRTSSASAAPPTSAWSSAAA